MNKKSRISLIVLLTVVLLLVVSIPALATGKTCQLTWRAYDEGEIRAVYINGEAETILDGNDLTATCTGNIPLGENPLNPYVTYFDLDDMRNYLCTKYGGAACDIGMLFIVGPAEYGNGQGLIDYQGDEYETYDWRLRVSQGGKFRLEKYSYINE